MQIIKDILNKPVCQELCTKIGKAGHHLKSLCQGYNNAAHPEILTIDNISGIVEGEIRGIKANLKINNEIRPQIRTMMYSATFLLKITKQDFFKDREIIPSHFKDIQSAIEYMHQGIKALEYEVTSAIIKSSQEIVDPEVFQIKPMKFPDFSSVKFDKSELVEKINLNQKIEKGLLSESILIVSETIASKAHEAQDLVSEHLHNTELKPFVQQIININGGIENEARACIAIARNSAGVNTNNLKNHMKKAKEAVDNLRKLMMEQQIWIPDIKETLTKLFSFQEKCMEINEKLANQA